MKTQNICDIAKAVLRGKSIAMSAYIKNSRNISNKGLNATSQTPRKTKTSKTQNKQERNNKNKN
jgi:hypothetical protein